MFNFGVSKPGFMEAHPHPPRIRDWQHPFVSNDTTIPSVVNLLKPSSKLVKRYVACWIVSAELNSLVNSGYKCSHFHSWEFSQTLAKCTIGRSTLAEDWRLALQVIQSNWGKFGFFPIFYDFDNCSPIFRNDRSNFHLSSSVVFPTLKLVILTVMWRLIIIVIKVCLCDG